MLALWADAGTRNSLTQRVGQLRTQLTTRFFQGILGLCIGQRFGAFIGRIVV